MAKRVKEIKLEELTIQVYELKYGKFKKVISKFSGLIGKFIGLLDNPVMDLSKGIPAFIDTNMPEIEQVLFEFTTLDSETIEEVYITEFALIFDEILKFYGFKWEDIKGFFTGLLKNPPQEVAQIQEQLAR